MKFNVNVSFILIAILIIGVKSDDDKPREKRTVHLFLQQFIDAFGQKPAPKVSKTPEPSGFKFNFFIRPLAKLSQPPPQPSTDAPKDFVPMSFPIQNAAFKVNLPFMPVIPMAPSMQMASTMPPPTMPPPTMPSTMPPETMPPTTMAPTTAAPTMPPTTMPPKMAAMDDMTSPQMDASGMMQPEIQPKAFMLDMTSSTDGAPKMMSQMGAMTQMGAMAQMGRLAQMGGMSQLGGVPQPQIPLAQKSNLGFAGNLNPFGQQFGDYDYYQPQRYQSFPDYQSNYDYNNNFADAFKANTYLPPFGNPAFYQQQYVPQESQTKAQQQPPAEESQETEEQTSTAEQSQQTEQSEQPQYQAPTGPQYVPQFVLPKIQQSTQFRPLQYDAGTAFQKNGLGSSHSSVKMHDSNFNYFTYHHDSDNSPDFSPLGHQGSYQFYGKRSVN